LILINPRGQGASGGKSPDEIAAEIAMDLESKLPLVMDIENEAHEITFEKNEEGAINSLGVFLG